MIAAPDQDAGLLHAPRGSLRRSYSPGVASRIVALATALYAADFFIPAMLEGSPPDFLSSTVLGILPAQLGLLAIWTTFGRGRWYARLLQSTAAASLGWSAFGLGLKLLTSETSGTMEKVFRSAAFVPLLLLAAQPPLWVARWIRGWLLFKPSANVVEDLRESRRCSMTDVLLAPLAVAVPLGLVRWQWKDFGGEFQFSLAMLFACMPIVSSFSTLPCLLTAFRSRTFQSGLLAIAAYSLGASTATNAILLAAFGAPPFISPLVSISLFIISMLFVIHGSLAMLRRGGLELLPVSAR